MKYTVVHDHDVERVIEEVNQLLNEGWTLQGGISVCQAENEEFANKIFAQALVRK